MIWRDLQQRFCWIWFTKIESRESRMTGVVPPSRAALSLSAHPTETLRLANLLYSQRMLDSITMSRPGGLEAIP
jgi:hypothetical protein